tara:strand:- start:136 stop:351 length:216 start_codon:yes stop_codon:yes gene_type:complete
MSPSPRTYSTHDENSYDLSMDADSDTENENVDLSTAVKKEMKEMKEMKEKTGLFPVSQPAKLYIVVAFANF